MATKKITLTIPEGDEEAAKQRARTMGLTLSAYVSRAVRRALAQDAMADLRADNYAVDPEWRQLQGRSILGDES